MIRMVLLTCAMQVCGLGISHAQTRDQIIVLAMLGQVPGDKAEAAGPSKVVASKRVDDQTINIEIKAGSDHKTIQIKEDPECVFSIGSNATYYAKIDFSRDPRIFANDTLVWLEGKNVSCSYIQGAAARLRCCMSVMMTSRLMGKEIIRASFRRVNWRLTVSKVRPRKSAISARVNGSWKCAPFLSASAALMFGIRVAIMSRKPATRS